MNKQRIKIKQIKQKIYQMFSMTCLQSQQSPLRTIDSYYQPKNRPKSKSRRKFINNQCNKSSFNELYSPQRKQLSIKEYLDGLGKAKSLSRKGLKNQEIYSFISFHRTNNKRQQTNNTIIGKDSSLSSIKLSSIGVSRASSLCSILDKKRNDSFTNKWKEFQSKLSARDQQSKNHLRFTFYNNQQKAKYLMEKYKKDQSLDQRGSNLYQNVFNRTVARQTLFATIGQIDKKRRKGQII